MSTMLAEIAQKRDWKKLRLYVREVSSLEELISDLHQLENPQDQKNHLHQWCGYWWRQLKTTKAYDCVDQKYIYLKEKQTFFEMWSDDALPNDVSEQLITEFFKLTGFTSLTALEEKIFIEKCLKSQDVEILYRLLLRLIDCGAEEAFKNVYEQFYFFITVDHYIADPIFLYFEKLWHKLKLKDLNASLYFSAVFLEVNFLSDILLSKRSHMPIPLYRKLAQVSEAILSFSTLSSLQSTLYLYFYESAQQDLFSYYRENFLVTKMMTVRKIALIERSVALSQPKSLPELDFLDCLNQKEFKHKNPNAEEDVNIAVEFPPEISIQDKINALRMSGCYVQAINLIKEDGGGNDLALQLQMIEMELLLERFDEAKSNLNKIHSLALTDEDKIFSKYLEGELFYKTLEFAKAKSCYEEVAKKNAQFKLVGFRLQEINSL
jgi:hypothetical protein